MGSSVGGTRQTTDGSEEQYTDLLMNSDDVFYE